MTFIVNHQRFTPETLSTREILEQALTHFLTEKTYESDGQEYTVEGWRAGEWFEDYTIYDERAGENVTLVTQACSMGAMLLATKMVGLQDIPKGFDLYFAHDSNFFRAVQILHNLIKERYTGWHAEYTSNIIAQAWTYDENQVGYWHKKVFASLMERSDGQHMVNVITEWNDDDSLVDLPVVVALFEAAIKVAVQDEVGL